MNILLKGEGIEHTWILHDTAGRISIKRLWEDSWSLLKIGEYSGTLWNKPRNRKNQLAREIEGNIQSIHSIVYIVLNHRMGLSPKDRYWAPSKSNGSACNLEEISPTDYLRASLMIALMYGRLSLSSYSGIRSKPITLSSSA
jgi:hypothetical protein